MTDISLWSLAIGLLAAAIFVIILYRRRKREHTPSGHIVVDMVDPNGSGHRPSGIPPAPPAP
jgi:LPXTG-motif cell wall-anchored protein